MSSLRQLLGRQMLLQPMLRHRRPVMSMPQQQQLLHCPHKSSGSAAWSL